MPWQLWCYCHRKDDFVLETSTTKMMGLWVAQHACATKNHNFSNQKGLKNSYSCRYVFTNFWIAAKNVCLNKLQILVKWGLSSPYWHNMYYKNPSVPQILERPTMDPRLNVPPMVSWYLHYCSSSYYAMEVAVMHIAASVILWQQLYYDNSSSY